MSVEQATIIAADYLERNAPDLVEQWIEWVRERVATDAVNALPEKALRNHIPPILVNVAKYLREPYELARAQMLQNLRLHGQIRRDQGFSLAEVLAEFDGLAEVVTDRVTEALTESGEEFSLEDVFRATNLLASGLRSISYIAMGTYAKSDSERAHQIAENLEHLSRAISHDISNPLHTISLGIEVIGDRTDDRSIDEQLTVMKAAVRRCKYLLDTLRVLTVAESARAGNNMVNVRDAINSITKEFRRSADLAGMRIEVDGDIPELLVEAILLYVVLANAVSNSIKYSDPDKNEQVISISTRYISEKGESGFCELVVKDNGVGIPKEFLPRVFQKGFRGHPELADGTGIGLYLAHQSIAARGGDIRIESVEGEGTTVTARMRCLNPASDAITAERFSVEHLMGEMVWNEVSDHANGRVRGKAKK